MFRISNIRTFGFNDKLVANFLEPAQIIKKYLCPKKSMVAVDFGCGSGGWAMPLAKILEDGKVYAIDLLEEPLSVLRSKIRTGDIVNVEVIKADVEKIILRLLANSADIVLMTNLLFQAKNKEAVLGEAKRILKPGGKLLVVDWSESDAIGPQKTIAAKDVSVLAKKLGFSPVDEFDAGSHHFGLIFEKNK